MESTKQNEFLSMSVKEILASSDVQAVRDSAKFLGVDKKKIGPNSISTFYPKSSFIGNVLQGEEDEQSISDATVKPLDLQRILALKTLSRGDEKYHDNEQSINISHLLKPNESMQATSTSSFNPSNFSYINEVVADITPGDITDVDGTQTAKFKSMSPSIREILATSDIQMIRDSVKFLEDDGIYMQQNLNVGCVLSDPMDNTSKESISPSLRQILESSDLKTVRDSVKILEDEYNSSNRCFSKPSFIDSALQVRKKEQSDKNAKPLELQQILALKTLSRDNEKLHHISKQSMSISYLLKPNESVQVTPAISLNPSNFFNISDNIDTTSGNVTKDVDNSQTGKPTKCLSPSVRLVSNDLQIIRDSVKFLDDGKNLPNESLNVYSCAWSNSNDNTLEAACKRGEPNINNISFKSISEDNEQRLLKDQIEWQNEYGNLPFGEAEKLNCADRSISTSQREMIMEESVASIGEYFRRSNDINRIFEAQTPIKKNPVALVDVDKKNLRKEKSPSTIKTKEKIGTAENEDFQSNSVASISTIAEALKQISDMDSPQTIYNVMMKKINDPIAQVDEIDKNLQGYDNSVIISGSIGIKNKENYDPTTRSVSSSTLNSTADFVCLTETFAAGIESLQLGEINAESMLERITDDSRKESKICNQINSKEWMKPTEIHNESLSQCNYSDTGLIDQNFKVQESFITLYDNNHNDQKLDITVIAHDVNFPILCPLFYSLKLSSKSNRGLHVKVNLAKLLINNNKQVEFSDIGSYIKIDIPKNTIFILPQKEYDFIIKICGFIESQIKIILILEDSEERDKRNKNTNEYSFSINFYKPSISVALMDHPQEIINHIDFGHLPSRSTHTIDILIKNTCFNILPLRMKIRGNAQKIFYMVIDSNLNVTDYTSELKNDQICKLRFITPLEKCKKVCIYEDILEIGIFINNEFLLLQSIKLTGREYYSRILFNKDLYPLYLEYGKTGFLRLYNEGLIDLSYKILITKDIEGHDLCGDNIFSIEHSEIIIKKGEELSLKISLNKSPLNTTRRYVVFQQTFNGPILHWPVVGESAPVQNFLKCITNPSDKKNDTKISPNSNAKKSFGRASSTMLTFKLPINKVSPAKSVQSSFSSGSATRLPIRSTKTYISWPSIKIGKSMSQDITIKNTSDKRIKINIYILTSGFTLGNKNESCSSMTMILHGLEVRTFSVTFSPQRNIIYATKLVFSDTRNNNCVSLPLVGFGGTSEVTISGIFKLPNGNSFLSLGKLSNASSMSASIKLYNTGSIPAFAQVVCENFKSNILFSNSEIHITPEIMIIQPNSYKLVHISFNPKKDFVNQHKMEVIEVASLTVMSGDDGLRQRARHLYHCYPLQNGEKFWTKLKSLFKKLDDEPCYSEITQIKEPISAVHDIIQSLKVNEITLTIENHAAINNDCSILADESIMFQSLCSETYSLCSSSIESWTFEPSRIIFYLPHNIKDVVNITNNYDIAYRFDVTPNTWFKIEPMSGLVAQKSSTEITISYVGVPLQRSQTTSIQIVIANDILKIPIELNT